jgi:hypothetical protein
MAENRWIFKWESQPGATVLLPGHTRSGHLQALLSKRRKLYLQMKPAL